MAEGFNKSEQGGKDRSFLFGNLYSLKDSNIVYRNWGRSDRHYRCIRA